MKKGIKYSALFLLTGFMFYSCGNQKKESDDTQNRIENKTAGDTLSSFMTDFENHGNQLYLPYDGVLYGYTDENEKPKGTSTINELKNISAGITSLNPIHEKGKGAKNSDWYLKISGNVTTSYPFGYVGTGFNFMSNRRALDISKFKGIKFWAKGNGDNYIVKIESPIVTDHAFHECKIFAGDEWEEFEINFEDFRQPSWKSAQVLLKDALKSAVGIQWQTDGQPIEKYLLCIDNIEFIK